MFRAVPCPSPGVTHCIFGTGTCYTGLTTACVQDQDGTQFFPDPARKNVPVLNVQWINLDDGQENCPKHVEFRTRINLEISASVGFVVKKCFI
jgi:hypothetical protein